MVPTKRDWAAALWLLDLANRDILSDLAAAGPDEVKQHPMFRSKVKLSDRIERFQDRIRRRSP